MNRYQFHQAAHVAGKDYPRGVHEVPEKAEYDPYFLKLVGLGLVTEAAATVAPPSSQVVQERNKALHDRLVKRADERRAKAHTSKAPVAEEKTQETAETGDDESDSDFMKSPKEKPSHSDKHRKK